jgi:hypothetical protein
MSPTEKRSLYSDSTKKSTIYVLVEQGYDLGSVAHFFSSEEDAVKCGEGAKKVNFLEPLVKQLVQNVISPGEVLPDGEKKYISKTVSAALKETHFRRYYKENNGLSGYEYASNSSKEQVYRDVDQLLWLVNEDLLKAYNVRIELNIVESLPGIPARKNK